ncbi:MAG: hypothetical protein EU533_01850, partial [Promethearchaeota archaeon]
MSNFSAFTGNNTILNEKNTNIPTDKENIEHLTSADFITSPDYWNITGNGIDQPVRLFMRNSSSAIGYPDGYFEIPAPTNNMNLSYGEFKFNFDNNYTTDYEIESFSARSAYSFSLQNHRPLNRYRLDSATSNFTLWNGTISSGTFGQLLTGNPLTITSNTNGIINFTVDAHFLGNGIGQFPNAFDRDNIIALILNVTYNIDENANLTVKIQDFFTNENVTIIDNMQISSSISSNEIDKWIINENLNFTSLSDRSRVQFIFENDTSTDFDVALTYFDLNSIMVFELPINTNDHVALEFDLRGENSTVNGFYAWIRTLNVTKAQNTKLNITLYRANATIRRTLTQLVSDLIEPDLTNGQIASVNLDVGDYTSDGPIYFEFDNSHTNNLTRYNYFIVISSDSNEDVFSLVTIPRDSTNFYGDGTTNVDHQLKTTENAGSDWKNAIYTAYTAAGQLDASDFILNITRGYMPSDFEINGERTLKIQEFQLEQYPQTVPSGEPALVWGFGYWNHNFTNPIGMTGNFHVDLLWNTTNIKGFNFNVNYTAIAFRNDNATSHYIANYNFNSRIHPDPEWIFNYSLDLYQFDAYYWNFTEFWFMYEDHYTAHNLTTPEGTEVFSQTGGASTMPNKPNILKVRVSTNIINVSEKEKYNDTYSLYLTGFNAILDSYMHSYINYKEILWQSEGFMFGDNISIGLDIRSPYGMVTNTGFTNVSLFDPEGKFISNLYYDQPGKVSKDKSKLSYDFDNHTIYDITESIPLQGKYYLGYFWTNGSIVGTNKLPIFIDSYRVIYEDCSFDSNADKYLLSGDHILNYTSDYAIDGNLLIATVNETSGSYDPDFYAVDNSFSPEDFLFSYNLKYSDYKYDVSMLNFKQNETVLNSNEEMNVKITIQNRDIFESLNVKLDVKLVSYINNEWIIDNATTPTKNIKKLGQSGDTAEFSVDLSIPSIGSDKTWKGYNAPIRQGGAITIITIYIENNIAGTYLSEDYSLIIPVEETIYDGYIIALKEQSSSRKIFQYFEKDECLYLPNNCTFITNIISKDYISTYNMVNYSIGLKSPIKFSNIVVNPMNPIQGKSFNITSTLTTEFDVPINNTRVSCEYYDGTSWINLTSTLTNSDGFLNLKVNTLDSRIKPKISTLFRLHKEVVSLTLNGTKSLTINIIIQDNKISLSSDDDDGFIYKNTIQAIEVNLKNTGNANLKIIDIDIDINANIDYEIRAEDTFMLNRFQSGESTTIIIELEVGHIDKDEIEVRVTIYAQNIISGENLIVTKGIDLDVIDKPLFDYFIEYFIYIALALLALIFLITLNYSKKTKKKIEKPLEEAEKKRPRKGRDVKVSELKLEKPEIEEKEVKEE